MGSDNAKTRSSGGARRIKKKAPPPEPENLSVGSHSTEDAMDRRSLQGSGNGSGNGSVASSASSIRLNAALLQKQKLAKRSRYNKEKTSSSGGMRASTIVTLVVFVSVVLYVANAFAASDGTIAGIDVIGLITGTTVLQVSETATEVTPDVAPDDKKLYEEDTPKEESPDAALAALASGSGGSLWEGIVTGGALEGETGADNVTGDNSTNTTLDNGSTQESMQEVLPTDSAQMMNNGTVGEGQQLAEGAINEQQQLINGSISEGSNAPDSTNADAQVAQGSLSVGDVQDQGLVGGQVPLSVGEVQDQGLLGGQVPLSVGEGQDQGLVGDKVKGYDTNIGQQMTEGAEIDKDVILQQMNQKLEAGGMTNSMVGDSAGVDSNEGNMVQQSTGNLRGSTSVQLADGQLQEPAMLRGSASQDKINDSMLPVKVTGYETNLNGAGNDNADNQQSSVGVGAQNDNSALQGGTSMLQQGSDGLTVQSADLTLQQGTDGMLPQNNGIAMQSLNQDGVQLPQGAQGSLMENGISQQDPNGLLPQNVDGALEQNSNRLLSKDSTLQDNALSEQGLSMTSQNGDSPLLAQGAVGSSMQNGDTESAMQQFSNQLLMQHGDSTAHNASPPQQGSNGVLTQNESLSQGQETLMTQGGDGTLQQQSVNQPLMQDVGSSALGASHLQQGSSSLVTHDDGLSPLRQSGDPSMSQASDLGLQQTSNQRAMESRAKNDSLSQQESSGLLTQNGQSLQQQDTNALMAQNTDGTMQQNSNQVMTQNSDTMLQNDAILQQGSNEVLLQSSLQDSSRSQISRQGNHPTLQNGVGTEQSQMLRSAGLASEMRRVQNSVADSSDNGLSNQMTAGVSNHGIQSVIGGGSTQLQNELQSNQLPQGRRLQEVVEPVAKSPYEDMTPAALTEYVSNHAHYRTLLNFAEDLPFQPSSQVPYFWHIHKSGGSSMKHLLTAIGMAQTRRGSDPICDDKADYIHLCPLNWGSAVNADASSIPGIERIRNLGLVYKNIPKLVVTTSRVYEALNIFDQHHRGRLFVVLRDPMERAVSKYYYTQIATWERNYNPIIANMTMIEYANSRLCFDNWITRRIINKMNPAEPVTEGDLRLAKEFLRQKAMILLTDDYSTSVYRLAKYFGWDLNGEQRWWIDKYTKNNHINKNPHPVPDKQSAEWGALRERHLLDIELYRYAIGLYHEQANFIAQKFGALALPEPIDPNLTDQVEPDESDVN